MNNPRLVHLSRFASALAGSPIIVAETGETIPFTVRRVYWIYSGSAVSDHGDHAHLNPEQMLVAINGIVSVEVTDRDGSPQQFLLDSPDVALYVPPQNWLNVKMSINSVLLCLSSHRYSEQQTVYDRKDFLSPV